MSLNSVRTNKNSKKFRIVILGDLSVGKSSIIERYISNKFESQIQV